MSKKADRPKEQRFLVETLDRIQCKRFDEFYGNHTEVYFSHNDLRIVFCQIVPERKAGEVITTKLVEQCGVTLTHKQAELLIDAIKRVLPEDVFGNDQDNSKE